MFDNIEGTPNKFNFKYSKYGCTPEALKVSKEKECKGPTNDLEYREAIKERMDYIKSTGYTVEIVDIPAQIAKLFRLDLKYRYETGIRNTFYIQSTLSLRDLLYRTDNICTTIYERENEEEFKPFLKLNELKSLINAK